MKKKQATTQHIPRDPPGKTITYTDRLCVVYRNTVWSHATRARVYVAHSLRPGPSDKFWHFPRPRWEQQMKGRWFFLCLKKPCTVQVYTIYLLQML